MGRGGSGAEDKIFYQNPSSLHCSLGNRLSIAKEQKSIWFSNLPEALAASRRNLSINYLRRKRVLCVCVAGLGGGIGRGGGQERELEHTLRFRGLFREVPVYVIFIVRGAATASAH